LVLASHFLKLGNYFSNFSVNKKT
jgi:hypothetical protein